MTRLHPSPPTDTARTPNAWDVWQPTWHGLFLALLGLTSLLSLDHAGLTWREAIVIGGLGVLFGGWSVLPLRWRGLSRLALVAYFVAGWALWYAATAFAPPYFLLLFALFPYVFMSLPFATALAVGMVLHSLVLLRLHFVNPSFTVSWMLFMLLAGISGGLLGSFITRIIRQSEDRRQLIARLEAAQDALARTQHQAGILSERQRLAGDLHDTITQNLTGILMHLENADYAAQASADPQPHLDLARQVARDALAETRRFLWDMREVREMHALNPTPPEHRAFVDSVRDLAGRWSRAASIPVDIACTGSVQPLPREVETAALRIVQEALTNVAKHARASTVRLTLSFMPALLVLDINDDGCGFVPSSQPPESPAGHFGLTSMRLRCEQLGGGLTLESAPGEGTTLVAEFPLGAVPTWPPAERTA